MPEMKKRVYIMRGISGSGKSTEVAKIWKEELEKLCKVGNESIAKLEKQNLIKICSADHYFMLDGKYNYDHSRIGDAQGMCLRNFVDALFDPNVRVIVVDNTHTETWEYAPYSALAQAYRCVLIVVEVHRDILICIQDNKHKVPASTIKAQLKRFQPTPSAFETRVIIVGKLPTLTTRILRRLFRRI